MAYFFQLRASCTTNKAINTTGCPVFAPDTALMRLPLMQLLHFRRIAFPHSR